MGYLVFGVPFFAVYLVLLFAADKWLLEGGETK